MVRRQTTETLVNHMTASNRLGLMTSQLLASTGLQASADILAQHLPHLGIPQALVGTYSHTEEDPLLYTQVLLAVGYPERAAGLTFLTRQFPPPELISPDQTYRLAILPLVIERQPRFAASCCEPGELRCHRAHLDRRYAPASFTRMPCGADRWPKKPTS